MSGTAGTSSKARKNIHGGAGNVRTERSRRKSEASPVAIGSDRPHFLTACFNPILVHEVARRMGTESKLDNYDLKAVNDDLLASFKRFCRLYKIKVPAEPTGDESTKFIRLLSTLEKYLPATEKGKVDYNIEHHDHLGYHFVLYKEYPTPRTFHLLNCDFLAHMERHNEKLFPIALEMVRLLYHSQQLTIWSDESSEMGYHLDMLREDLEYNAAEMDDEDKQDMQATIEYYDAGEPYRFGLLLSYKPRLDWLEPELEEYQAAEGYEAEFIKVFRTGIKLLQEDHIQKYASYQPHLTEYGTPVEVNRYCGLIWTYNDRFSDMYAETLNQDMGEFNTQEPNSWAIISKKKAMKFIDTDWTVRFSDWLLSLIGLTIDYSDERVNRTSGQ